MPVKIRFATDFVCPYCYAAEVPLKQAIGGREDIELELLPLELTPTDRERVDTFHDEARRAKWAEDLVPFCGQIGLDAHFPPNVIPRPYTRLAWQGYHFANARGQGSAYAEAMYRAYFTDERDIGNLDVLCDIAETLGLDPADFRASLERGEYSERQDEAVRQTLALGVKAVPTIWINDMRLAGDLYTKEDFEFYLTLAEGGSADSFGGGLSCGPDGC